MLLGSSRTVAHHIISLSEFNQLERRFTSATNIHSECVSGHSGRHLDRLKAMLTITKNLIDFFEVEAVGLGKE